MIKTSVYKISPYLAEGYQLPNTRVNNGTAWLREAINLLYNRNKERLRAAGVVTNLFHNHDEQSGQNISRYPLIQYQKHQSAYYVAGLNEGSHALDQLFIDVLPVYTTSEQVQLVVKSVFNDEQPVAETHSELSYTLTNWLPFSNENYKRFKQMLAISDKIEFLEQNLKNHLAKDFFHYLNLGISTENILLKLSAIDSFSRSCVPVKVNRHIHDFQPFTVTFTTNVLLPRFICLGNGKVYGFGLVEATNPNGTTNVDNIKINHHARQNQNHQ